MKRNGLLVLILFPAFAWSQNDSTTAAEEKQSNTYAPLIEFTSVQKSDNSIDLKASVKAKIAGTLTKMNGLKMEFYAGTDSSLKKLGEVMTDKNGIAILNSKADQFVADGEGKLNFKTAFSGKDSIEAAEEVLSIKKARLEMTPVKEDSLLTVNLKLVDLSTGTETAVPQTDLGVFVKRMFSNLKVGEGTTDESGEAIVEIPGDLPGDAKGNIFLIASLTENDVYGNLEASISQQWGVPVSDVVKKLPRALWSPYPPVWMLVTFVILMGTVWGHYIVIIVQLFRLRKEEPKTTPS
jgi:hypothetical protein